jgi:hypothetical protein
MMSNPSSAQPSEAASRARRAAGVPSESPPSIPAVAAGDRGSLRSCGVFSGRRPAGRGADRATLSGTFRRAAIHRPLIPPEAEFR